MKTGAEGNLKRKVFIYLSKNWRKNFLFNNNDQILMISFLIFDSIIF